MCCHRTGDGPGGREGERQQDHRSVDRDVWFGGCRDRRLGALHGRQHEKIERQSDHDVRSGPGKAGVAPADVFEAQRRQRPSDGRGKPRQQRDAGDRTARGVAIDTPEGGEGCVVQAKRHPDAEQQPGDDQHGNGISRAEQRQPHCQRQVGDRQHLPAADQVDLPADARAEQGCDHQRGRERRKDPVRGDAEVARDRIGENRRQVIARRPREGLRGAERQNDRKLPSAHGLRAIFFLAGVVRIRILLSCFSPHRIGGFPDGGNLLDTSALYRYFWIYGIRTRHSHASGAGPVDPARRIQAFGEA